MKRHRIGPTRAALIRPWLGVFIRLVVCFAWASLVHAQAPCAAPFGRVVSVQGDIEIMRAGTAQWNKVERLNGSVCAGDIVHAGKHSRADLLLAPESLLQLDQFPRC